MRDCAGTTLPRAQLTRPLFACGSPPQGGKRATERRRTPQQSSACFQGRIHNRSSGAELAGPVAQLVENPSGERVLIVGHDDSEASFLHSILEPLGVNVTNFITPEEISTHLRQGSVALMLVDADRLWLSPAEFVRQVRSGEHCANVPIAFLGESRECIHALADGAEPGIVDFIQKPIDSIVLYAKARALLELHRCSGEVGRLTEQVEEMQRTNRIAETRAAFGECLVEARANAQWFEAALQAALPQLGDAALLTLDENGSIQKWGASTSVRARPRLDLDDWRFELIPTDVMRRRNALIVLDSSDSGPEAKRAPPGASLLRELGLGGCSCFPLIVGGRALGAVMFLRAGNDSRYARGDAALAQDLARRLALAIENLRSQELANRVRAELEASGRAKDAFLATLSHELRAPLNAIVGWAKMLAAGEVARDKEALAVSTIDRNARALASLIADLVDQRASGPWSSRAPSPGNRPSGVHELLSGVHALVVEDDPDSRELVETILRRFGADVTCVGTVQAAFGAIAAHRPDVLVSDIGLPDDDGLTLIRRIRETDELAALPAIALSAYASRRDVSQALAAGFQAYVAKPIEPDQLGRIVADVVGG